MGEDVEDEFADVVIDPTPFFDGVDDGGEVVVSEHHGGRLPGHFGARAAMAMPMSAARSAGASLTPSPVMATTCPWVRRASAIRSLASGELRAKTSSGPESSSWSSSGSLMETSTVVWTGDLHGPRRPEERGAACDRIEKDGVGMIEGSWRCLRATGRRCSG